MTEAFINLDEKALKQAETFLHGMPKLAPKAIVRAMNRTIKSVRAEASRQVRAEYTVKAGDFKEHVKIKKATPKDLEAEFRGTSLKQTMSLSHFKIQPRTDTTGNKQRPVKATIKKGSPFKVDKGFVWKGNVFHRNGREHLPIKVMSGPTVPRMLNDDEIIKKLRQEAQKTFEKRLEHEISASIKGLSKS